jgi:hypothetical protein
MKDQLHKLAAMIEEKKLIHDQLKKELELLQATYDLQRLMLQPHVHIIAMTNSNHIQQAREMEEKWELITSVLIDEVFQPLKLNIQGWRKVHNGFEACEFPSADGHERVSTREFTWCPSLQLCAQGLSCDCETNVDTHLVEFSTNLMQLGEVSLAGILIRR